MWEGDDILMKCNANSYYIIFYHTNKIILSVYHYINVIFDKQLICHYLNFEAGKGRKGHSGLVLIVRLGYLRVDDANVRWSSGMITAVGGDNARIRQWCSVVGFIHGRSWSWGRERSMHRRRRQWGSMNSGRSEGKWTRSTREEKDDRVWHHFYLPEEKKNRVDA